MNNLPQKISAFLFMFVLSACAGQERVPQQGADWTRGFGKNDPARKLWEEAEQGSSEAQLNLGKAFAKGNGVPIDHAQAKVWYEKAALNGNTTALNLLGKASVLKCVNGQRFVIHFNQGGENAQILMEGQSAPQILKNNHIGAGIELESDNGEYVFAEHNEKITLSLKEKATTCHEVK